jgi:(1->4)-alpha-D-glucan 1-alpha-D-glucosylmutase
VPTERCATYRVQLHPGFTFDDAAGLADYLAALGVSHLYLSPILQAAPGSTHGYDVVDPGRVSEALGGEAAYDRLSRVLADRGLGQLLDVVPNHMAVAGRDNRWWWDVLENGPASRYADYFDIDWDPPEAKLRHTVLVPILGDHYGRVLEAGDLRLVRAGGGLLVRYHEHEMPVAPGAVAELLARAATGAGLEELARLAGGLAALPLPANRAAARARGRAQEALRAELAALAERDERVARAIDAEVERVNSDPDVLDALLRQQHYRLAYWRTAGRELDYRRFFDIASLVALRTEDPEVFAEAHACVLRLLADGKLDGLRIDHPDGLRDPAAYFHRLQAAGAGWVVAEKILAPGEHLRADWPVAGTTGYEFARHVTGLFVDPAAEGPLARLYADFTGQPADYAAVALESKHHVMRTSLAADVERLVALFVEVCEQHRRYRDYTRTELRHALRETLAALPVYRTYVRAETGAVADEDVRLVSAAAADARGRRPDLDGELFDFLTDVLLLRRRGDVEAQLAMRFQQVSAAVAAKGVEDTAFYRFNRLVALNEVGGDPGRFGTTVDEFHAWNARTARDWPSTLLATSTHDTKRSEDVRARLVLLSEVPDLWASAVWRWAWMNERHWRNGTPDRNAEYLLYQTLVGAFPLETDRALAYMEKAVREAKLETSWLDRAPAYEERLRAFVRDVSADESFTRDLEAFVVPLLPAARTVSLAQTLLKLTAPGVPDLYQGTELWDSSLVDPDNRRPVDFGLRRALLEALRDASPEDALARVDEGAPKLWLVQQALAARRRDPAPFAGDYAPLRIAGERMGQAVAFLRGGTVATVVPRLVCGLRGDWRDTSVILPAGRWRNQLTGDALDGGPARLADVLARFPVALLRRE